MMRAVAVWVAASALMAYGLFLAWPLARAVLNQGIPQRDYLPYMLPYMLPYLLAAFYGAALILLGFTLAAWELFHMAFRRASDAVARRRRFLHLWFGFGGRLSRGRFLACAVALWFITPSWALGVVGMVVLETASETVRDAVLGAWLVCGACIFWVWSATSVKRCHDRNRPAAFLLVALIPLCQMVVFRELHFRSGTEGPNRYGPDPKRTAGPPEGLSSARV